MTRWHKAGIAAFAAIAVSAAFGFIPGSETCPAHPPLPAWGAFQKIESVAEAQAFLIGDCPGALKLGMAFDALVFIPVYAAFLLFVASAARAPRPLWIAALAMLAIGISADEIEGLRLLGIIDANGGTATTIIAANAATWTKDLLLALATVPVGLAVYESGGWRRVSGGIATLGAAVAATGAVMAFPGLPALAVAWLTLAITAWVMMVSRAA